MAASIRWALSPTVHHSCQTVPTYSTYWLHCLCSQLTPKALRVCKLCLRHTVCTQPPGDELLMLWNHIWCIFVTLVTVPAYDWHLKHINFWIGVEWMMDWQMVMEGNEKRHSFSSLWFCSPPSVAIWLSDINIHEEHLGSCQPQQPSLPMLTCQTLEYLWSIKK